MKQSKRLVGSRLDFSVIQLDIRGPFRSLSQNETILEQRRLRTLAWVFLLLAILLLGSVRALAIGNACQSVHDVNREKAEQSLRARQKILKALDERIVAIASTQRGMMKAVMREIFDMEDLSLKPGPLVIGGMKMDFRHLQQTPDIVDKTMEALTWVYTFDLDPVHQEQRRQKAIDAVESDPYFTWLQDHQYNDQSGPESDVRDLLFAVLEDYPPGKRYTPELAILEVYQKADPRASPNQIQRIDEIRQMHENMAALLEDRRILKMADSVAGPENAWGLAPNLEEAKKNLDLLLQQQVQSHASRFPQKSFEIASRLISPQPHAQKSLASAQLFGKSSKSSPGLPSDMDLLKKTLQLPADFPTVDLKRVIEALRQTISDPRGGSYQIFLLNAFEDPSSPSARRARSLLPLIEFMEVVKELGGDEKLWKELIDDHVWRFYRH